MITKTYSNFREIKKNHHRSLETSLSLQQKCLQLAGLLDLSSLSSKSILLDENKKSNTVPINFFRLNNSLSLTQ